MFVGKCLFYKYLCCCGKLPTISHYLKQGFFAMQTSLLYIANNLCLRGKSCLIELQTSLLCHQEAMKMLLKGNFVDKEKQFFPSLGI
jgi:hypothetical protein